jgi:hypothetical protein
MSEVSVDTRGTALVTKIGVDKEDNTAVASWLVKAMLLGAEFPGFISSEIMPPETEENWEWTLVQRFREGAQIEALKKSEALTKFLAELQAAFAEKGMHISQEQKAQHGSRGAVTTAIATEVKPGMEASYREWESRVQLAQAKFAGYQGSYFQPPSGGGGGSGTWVTLLRFDSPESLDRWFTSPERKAMLDEAQKLVASTDIRRSTGSFPGWFPTDEKTGAGPPNWKTFLLVLLGLYPIVSLEIRFLMPALSQVPIAPANLIGNSISVALTTWATMPLFIKLFGPWLFPAGKQSVAENVKWLAIMAALFVAEVALLWNLIPGSK